jgi:hypothetical protein
MQHFSARAACHLDLHQLAWELVDEHRSLLTAPTLQRLFVQLGSGEYGVVIRAILEVAEAADQFPRIRSNDNIIRWLDGYADHADYGRLRQLVMRAVLRG